MQVADAANLRPGRLFAFDPRHGDDRRGALAKAGKGR